MPLSQHTTYMFKNFITYRVNCAHHIFFPWFMIIFVWFYILGSLLCFIKMYEVVCGGASMALARLRKGSMAPERLRNTDLELLIACLILDWITCLVTRPTYSCLFCVYAWPGPLGDSSVTLASRKNILSMHIGFPHHLLWNSHQEGV
jgi:hypothetical protein